MDKFTGKNVLVVLSVTSEEESKIPHFCFSLLTIYSLEACPFVSLLN